MSLRGTGAGCLTAVQNHRLPLFEEGPNLKVKTGAFALALLLIVAFVAAGCGGSSNSSSSTSSASGTSTTAGGGSSTAPPAQDLNTMSRDKLKDGGQLVW